VSTESNTTATPPNPAFPDHPDWAGPTRFAVLSAVVGLAIFFGAGLANYASASDKGFAFTQFFLSWTVGWIFWLSLPIGGMALLMIHYLAKSSWGRLLSRLLEASTKTLPLMILLWLPLAYGVWAGGHSSQYWWAQLDDHSGPHPAHAEASAKAAAGSPDDKLAKQLKMHEEQVAKAVAHEQEERRKGTLGFLTKPFWVGASLVYFAIWGGFIFFLNTWSREAQSDPLKVERALKKCENLSGPGLIIYAMTITAAVSHWVMSLEPAWASTMFPVIFAVASFLVALAFCVTCFLTLSEKPPLKTIMRPKFQLDMGTLMLAFTLFWSYTSFSQMMLIWIGNLPEEIPYFLKRSNGTGWWWVSAALIVFHFALPFILLLFRDIKLHPKRLRAVAVYLLVVCALDVAWWIEPVYPHDGPFFIAMDIGAIAGIGGVWGLGFLYFLKQRPLIPENQLYMLPEGHDEHH
jgi:hypothetical protein